MTAKLELYNNALAHAGERKLSSLSEGVEARRILDDVYAQAVEYGLERGMWNFAQRTVSIDTSTTYTPAFGYNYAFERPTDWVRTIKVADNERFEPIMLDFEDEGDYWYCDADPIYVKYVSNGVTFGGDLSRWPATFAEYIEFSLARRICKRLVTSNVDFEQLQKDEKEALKTARAADALNQPPGFPPAGSWVRSRGGGRSIIRSRWNGRTI